MSKPKMITQEYSDGNKVSVVWCPFWGPEPTEDNVPEGTQIKETENCIEYILPKHE